MQEDNRKSMIKKLGIAIASVILLIVVVAGVSYAWFTLTLQGNKTQIIKTGNFGLTITPKSGSAGVSLTKSKPLSDTYVKNNLASLKPYEFTVTNNSDISATYKLTLVDNALSTASKRTSDSDVRVYLVKGTTVTNKGLNEFASRLIDTGTLAAKGTVSYKVLFYIKESATNAVQGTEFNASFKVDGTQVLN